MDLNTAKEVAQSLIASAKAQGATSLSFALEDFDFQVEFAAKVAPAAPVVASTTATAAAPAEAPAADLAPEVVGTPVKSPIVGTYYASPNPESEAFVSVGQQVKKGDTLCIVEAMKMLNEITAPCDGTIARVFCQNGELVEYDQEMMRIGE